MRTRRLLGAVLVLALGAMPGCAELWGFDEGRLAADQPKPGGGLADAASSGSADASRDVDLDAIAPDAPPNCTARASDPGGSFVDDFTGSDVDGCGGSDAPCRSLVWLFSHYDPQRRPFVHVAFADYTGSLAIPAALGRAGLTIQGGWAARFEGARRLWTPYCGAVPTRIVGTGSSVIAVESDFVETSTGDAGNAAADPSPSLPYDLVLAQLDLVSKPAAGASETLIGVLATKARVRLTDCRLTVARGGGGSAGVAGTPGAGNQGDSCPPNEDLSEGSDGLQGPPGSASPNPLPGTFGPSGYAAPLPSPSQPGGPGSPGGPPTPCALALLGSPKAGCGGLGGGPGTPGGPGGASVGVYLWGSRGDLTRVLLETAGGGDGALGGNGGVGGDGERGRAGVGVCVNLGLLGTVGGKGGTGGAGASGPGGPSYCTAIAGGSSVATDAVGCSAGPGGASGDSTAPPAGSGDLYTEGDGRSQPSP